MRHPAASLVRPLVAAGAAALLAACAPDAATAPAAERTAALARGGGGGAGGDVQRALAEVRAATARYHRVEAAIADGYVNTHECAASPEGGMGIHFVNEALLGAPIPGGDAVVDPVRPEVLVYEPQANGKLRLVAAEYLVWRTAWDAAHPGTEPALFGTTFVQSFGAEAHGLPDHYELHAWVWRQNPSGMFAQWNPKVACP
jgi:hypothetical protein